jgi:hypothetical protein
VHTISLHDDSMLVEDAQFGESVAHVEADGQG